MAPSVAPNRPAELIPKGVQGHPRFTLRQPGYLHCCHSSSARPARSSRVYPWSTLWARLSDGDDGDALGAVRKVPVAGPLFTGGVQPMPPAAGLPTRLRPGPSRRPSSACAAARPGPPAAIEHDVRGFHGDREHRQPPRVAQAPPHAEDHSATGKQGKSGRKNRSIRRAEGVSVPAAAGARGGPGAPSRSLSCWVFFTISARVGASVPRPHATSAKPRAGPRGQGPLPAAGGPVPGPDGGLGHNRGDSGHPSEGPGGPGPVQWAKKTSSSCNRALLLSRAIPALSPRRRVRATTRRQSQTVQVASMTRRPAELA